MTKVGPMTDGGVATFTSTVEEVAVKGASTADKAAAKGASTAHGVVAEGASAEKSANSLAKLAANQQSPGQRPF